MTPRDRLQRLLIEHRTAHDPASSEREILAMFEAVRDEYEPDVWMQATWKKARQLKEFHPGAAVVGLLMEKPDGTRALIKHGCVTWPNPHQMIKEQA